MSLQWPTVREYCGEGFARHEGPLRVLVASRLLNKQYEGGEWKSVYRPPYFFMQERQATPEIRAEADRIAGLISSDDSTLSAFREAMQNLSDSRKSRY